MQSFGVTFDDRQFYDIGVTVDVALASLRPDAMLWRSTILVFLSVFNRVIAL